MFVHSVYFWLKEDLSEKDRASFVTDLKQLADIPECVHFHCGEPVPSERPVVVGDYTYGIACVFADRAGHDAYQVHALHKAFLERNASKWDKVVIYDFD